VKHYAGHESTYQRLEAAGETCWDRRAYDDFFMRPFLERALAMIGPPAEGAPPPRALEIGCGTGPVSCHVAARGYDVVGVDLSPTAVRMATRFAAERNLRARFEVHDVIELPGEALYDVIIDGHCLHCVVFDDDRARLLATVRRLLKPGGAFIVETMARHATVRFDNSFVLDDDGILWLRYDGGDRADTRIIDGAAHHPNRRILPPDALAAELVRAGFAVEWSQALVEEKAGEPQNYQAVLRRRD
jgi:SAM-dependent methyltransferase